MVEPHCEKSYLLESIAAYIRAPGLYRAPLRKGGGAAFAALPGSAPETNAPLFVTKAPYTATFFQEKDKVVSVVVASTANTVSLLQKSAHNKKCNIHI